MSRELVSHWGWPNTVSECLTAVLQSLPVYFRAVQQYTNSKERDRKREMSDPQIAPQCLIWRETTETIRWETESNNHKHTIISIYIFLPVDKWQLWNAHCSSIMYLCNKSADGKYWFVLVYYISLIQWGRLQAQWLTPGYNSFCWVVIEESIICLHHKLLSPTPPAPAAQMPATAPALSLPIKSVAWKIQPS